MFFLGFEQCGWTSLWRNMVGHLLQNSTNHIIIFNKIYLHSTTHFCSTSTFPTYIQHLYLFNFTEMYLYSMLRFFLYSTSTSVFSVKTRMYIFMQLQGSLLASNNY